MSSVARYRWQQGAVLGDLARAFASLLVSILFLLSSDIGSFIFVVSAGAVILFSIYLVDCVSKMGTVVEADAVGIRVIGGVFGTRNIDWQDLDGFELRHFSVGRFRRSKWMDMKLKSKGRSILIDDRLEQFSLVLRQTWSEVQKRELAISDTTLANLAACEGLRASGVN